MLISIRCNERNKGSVFLLAMVALVALLILGTSLVESAVQGLGIASREQKIQEAASLAEAGVDMVLCKLYEDYDNINTTLESTGAYSSSFTLPAGTVNYTVTAPFQGIADTCMIESEAYSWAHKRVQVRAIAFYQRDVNRVFQGAIFSDNPLTLNGAGGVYPDADGDGGQIYANGNITFNGTSFTMSEAGALYSTETINWVPNEVPATSVHQNVAPIPMPIIDLNYYQSQATTTYSGNKTFAGNHTFNGIIYVDGDVNIKGTYSGQAIIVASGNITITGNLTANDINNDTLALLSTKQIKLNGTPTVHALLYSHSVTGDASAVIGGNSVIYGAVVSDVVTTNGGIELYYRDVWDILDLPGKGKTQWAQISWEEHLR